MASGAAAQPTNYCSKCGKPLEAGAGFCATCGSPATSGQQGVSAQNVVKVPEGKPEVYLKRAWGLITEVEKATEAFRQRAIQHDAQLEENQPFIAGLVSSFRGASQLKREKSSLVADLQLATSEVEKAAASNPEVVVRVDATDLGITAFRATILHLSGQLEMIWGKSETAKDIFFQSIQVAELPDAHYMLGLLYESEYKPADALKHFERCLELDPDGELSVPALREAEAMRRYKKKFRGNWLIFIILLMFPIPFVFGIVYFLVKRK